MLEETLREELNNYLKNPSNERLQKLTNAIQRFHEKRPACPQCKNDNVCKFGMNHRELGRDSISESQYLLLCIIMTLHNTCIMHKHEDQKDIF
jgi:recombinational DNA repair protein RecR